MFTAICFQIMLADYVCRYVCRLGCVGTLQVDDGGGQSGKTEDAGADWPSWRVQSSFFKAACNICLSFTPSYSISSLLRFPYQFCVGYAVAQLVEALHYKPEGLGSIPDGVIGIFP